LKQVLRKHQTSATEAPFVGFLKSVTELYLLCVLGDRSSVSGDTWETRQNTARLFLEACFCPSGGQDEEEEEEEEGEDKEEEKEEGEDDEEKEEEEGEEEGEEEWTEEEAKELKMIMGERYDDLWDAVNGVKAYTLTA
jgi:TATA-binding protein-associated factor Taf7